MSNTDNLIVAPVSITKFIEQMTMFVIIAGYFNAVILSHAQYPILTNSFFKKPIKQLSHLHKISMAYAVMDNS